MSNVINPFFVARTRNVQPIRPNPRKNPVYVQLPCAPQNASPVPHLTSLYHFNSAGDYGDRGYPGNCGGCLIKDLLRYFQPQRVFDPMTGSGTCADLCRELGIDCLSGDIHHGFDACDPTGYPPAGSVPFVWIHPPYWRQKLYAADQRDLSRTPTLEAFLEKYQQVLRNCAEVLSPGGTLAVLMGDYIDREAGFVPLVYHTKRLAFAAGLQQRCTDIIRFSHGNTSSRKIYRTSFIPGLHDVCCLFTKTEL